jgi:urease accessory protein
LILKQLLESWSINDTTAILHWSTYSLAGRETFELRNEEVNRARAFYRVLVSLEKQALDLESIQINSQLTCFSYICERWNIDYQQTARGLIFSWLGNLVLAAIKIIPSGQTDGQKAIFELLSRIINLVAEADAVADDDIGASSMALAIASAQHESQYSRLFRSAEKIWQISSLCDSV